MNQQTYTTALETIARAAQQFRIMEEGFAQNRPGYTYIHVQTARSYLFSALDVITFVPVQGSTGTNEHGRSIPSPEDSRAVG